MHFLELAFNLVGTVVELAIDLTMALFRPHRRRAKRQAGDAAGQPAQPPALPEGTLFGVAIALRDGEADATACLPGGWRGYYTGIADDPSPDDRAAAGDEVRLVPEADHEERQEAVRVEVVLPDGSAAPIGNLSPGHDLGRSLELGRVRCWFAGRKRTLRTPNAAVILVAVHDP